MQQLLLNQNKETISAINWHLSGLLEMGTFELNIHRSLSMLKRLVVLQEKLNNQHTASELVEANDETTEPERV